MEYSMLSALERNFIFSTIEKCRTCSTPVQLEEILTYFVGGFIPHKMRICGIGSVDGKVAVQRLHFACPPKMAEEMPLDDCMQNNFLLPLWMKERTPQYTVVAAMSDGELSDGQRAWRDQLLGYGIRNVAVHGKVDAASGLVSSFYLCGLSQPMTGQQAEVFSMLVPHLHQALQKVLKGEPASRGKVAADGVALTTAEPRRSVERADWGLTRREAEILKWIYYGKTNSETAKILGISELTVRNHMQNLMLKLGVGNRTQAVVKAMQHNIFSEETLMANQH
jgi:DNA-binding CsgD family transcriptional regulator